ncbi:hypothetical protein [Oceanospirillum sediminis]|uniref:Uncharacterized protein n=1 Tax=Oceanospirillum sediminis TaxID=2760088 RepID=A0A839IYE5_9GAMM|nr:hypothetical protein [Oceanospirillum sediminis]MBB1489397.1 hypothetical protein [Oceanospirillum sediminis]
MALKESEVYKALLSSYGSEVKSISELSYDSSNQRSFIDSYVLGLDFDSIANCNGRASNERSPDSLFYNDGVLYFVEFKSGVNAKKEDIRLKIHEACATLFFFCKENIESFEKDDFFRLNIKYGVVFRDKSKGRKAMYNALSRSVAKYSLNNLEGYIISEAATVSKGQYILKMLRDATGWKVPYIELHSGTNIKFFC